MGEHHARWPIAADGTFSLRERFSRTFREGRERFLVKVDGQVTATGATGTLSVTSVLRSPDSRGSTAADRGRHVHRAPLTRRILSAPQGYQRGDGDWFSE